MRKKNQQKTAGTSPGTLQYTGPERSHRIQATVIRYDSAGVELLKPDASGNFTALKQPGKFLWVHIDGVYETAVIENLGRHFGLHVLVMEDLLSISQRPKAEDYGDFLFFIMKKISIVKEEAESEQVAVILGKDFVLSIQETPGNFFQQVQDRLMARKGRLPLSGPDYLTYRLLDSLVDTYMDILSDLEDHLDKLEGGLIARPDHFSTEHLFHLRQQSVILKKATAPLRDFISFFRKTDSPLFHQDLNVFLMDFSDHVTRVAESVESCKESMAAMFDLYLSQNDRKLNEVMKLLTVISTIFIPLGFLTSYFGMNFEPMFRNEYKSAWTYPAFIIMLVVIVIGQMMLFRRKRWI